MNDNNEDLQRQQFEDAAYTYYLERHAAGKLPDSGHAPMIKEGVMWRHQDGTYGVLMFNAAWWAWQTGQAPLIEKIEALEALRPHWAKGYSDDSVAAQAATAALSSLWEVLGATNQTEAMQKLVALTTTVMNGLESAAKWHEGIAARMHAEAEQHEKSHKSLPAGHNARDHWLKKWHHAQVAEANHLDFAKHIRALATHPQPAAEKDCYCGGWSNSEGEFHNSGCPEIAAITPARVAGMSPAFTAPYSAPPAVPFSQPDVVKHMVNRFLGWPIPRDFRPDCGIDFTPAEHPNGWPIGTNLFTADQARMMFEHAMVGLPQWPDIPKVPAKIRRFAHATGFANGAAYVEFEDGQSRVVGPQGEWMANCEVHLEAAELFVRRGTWREVEVKDE